MTNFLAFQVAGVELPLPFVIAAVVALLWAVVALAAIIAPVRARMPLAISTIVLAGAWGFAFDARSLVKSKAKVAEASTVSTARREGSCASIRTDMTGDQVRKKIGMPDEVRNDDKVRGPGSTVLIYKDLRCAVHLFEEKVEFVD